MHVCDPFNQSFGGGVAVLSSQKQGGDSDQQIKQKDDDFDDSDIDHLKYSLLNNNLTHTFKINTYKSSPHLTRLLKGTATEMRGTLSHGIPLVKLSKSRWQSKHN